MPELFVFTIFAAVVTLYSVLPKHRQLRANFAISSRAKWAATIGGLIIILLYLFELYLETASQGLVGVVVSSVFLPNFGWEVLRSLSQQL